MRFSRQESWSGLPFPSSGNLPDPGIEPGSSALQADSLPTELWGKSHTLMRKRREREEGQDEPCLSTCISKSLTSSFDLVGWNSVQFSSVVQSSDSLRPHESHYARSACPSLIPGVCWNSCPLSQWCHPAISSSVVPFSYCPQSLPASGSFLVSISMSHTVKILSVWMGQILNSFI